ncbi:unnamed protein product [Triticum turgidum subsp. durum]|uniref:PPPDE domain-containing protein n=1 Tax=Triticum turgidum subsp. durum TaxID=4567 RepID=A0A9R0YYN3_TRITD|nr:unnamed protein product [Triticum turgidum subsp. durum]
MMAEEGHKVALNVYDLSNGLARQLSTSFLGKPIEAIWHTGVVVYGNEYFVGAGIPDYILNLPSEVMSSPMGAMIMPMIQNLEATLRNNAAPQTTQFVPTPASLSVPKPTAAAATAASKTPTCSTTAAAASAAPTGSSSKQEEEKKVEKQTPEKAAAAAAPAMADPLGSARGKVQEEVMREFAALMASGTLRASEAAALAMRRVMERHGDGASMQA